MKKVLMLCYYFPPIGGAGTQRSSKLVKYLPRHGWMPTVIAGVDYTWPQDRTLLDDIPEGVAVHRLPVPVSVWRRARHWMFNHRVGPVGWGHLANRLGWFLDFPCTKREWADTAAQLALHLVKSEKFDAIYASLPPYSVATALRAVRQELGLPLVLDFRDPWATNEVEFGHLPKWLQRRHDSAERDAVLAADLVVSAHPMLTEYFIRRYGIRPDRCATIYNGFDEDDFGVPAPRQTASAKKFTLTHTGSFYRQYNPGVMASALHEHWSSAVKGVDEVELRFVGGAAATEFKRSPGLEIVVTPRVEHDVAVREQIQADMLLLIIDRHFYPGVIAAKLFEYLAAGRPIFGVLPEDGTMAQIIRECRAGWVADCDQPRQIVETLREAVQAVAHPGFRFDPDRERIRQFSRSSQARRMAALFDAIGPAEPTL